MSKTWVPFDLASLPNCRFLANDPSLAATGLVMFEVHEGEVVILGAEKVSTTRTGLVGWEDTFARAAELVELLRTIITGWTFDYGDTYLTGVHEAPPVGGEMLRKESSILAGFAFETVCRDLNIPLAPLVVPTAHKYALCGNGRAKKPEHHAVVKELLLDIFDGKMIKNEATRDALSIGLYAAQRKMNESTRSE